MACEGARKLARIAARKHGNLAGRNTAFDQRAGAGSGKIRTGCKIAKAVKGHAVILYSGINLGGGNAALCAALMAREAGASVLLLESAPRAWRGGNSAHTRNLRCMHDAPQDVLVEAYPEEEFWQDLLKVTGANSEGAAIQHVSREGNVTHG